jgi:hypothetical protein
MLRGKAHQLYKVTTEKRSLQMSNDLSLHLETYYQHSDPTTVLPACQTLDPNWIEFPTVAHKHGRATALLRSNARAGP